MDRINSKESVSQKHKVARAAVISCRTHMAWHGSSKTFPSFNSRADNELEIILLSSLEKSTRSARERCALPCITLRNDVAVTRDGFSSNIFGVLQSHAFYHEYYLHGI